MTTGTVEMHPSTLLAHGFGLHYSDPLVEARQCALCGRPITHGVPLQTVIRDSTADLADTFRCGTHLCTRCAACFGETRLLAGNLFADESGALKPVVALASATPERPAWRDLVRQQPPGSITMAIVTSNSKRRLWPSARISVFGNAWQPLFVDNDIERVLTIHVARLLDCLDLIEEIYALGFSKIAIKSTLLRGIDIKSLAGDSSLAAGALQYEHALAPWRGTDEFVLALFIAQKETSDHA